MSTTATTLDTAKARRAMIDSQLRTSGVNEEYILARMMAVPREDFLPEAKASLAYIDRSVAVEGGALAAPLFYGKLLLEAAPVSDDRVLVVDGGTGYLTALLGPLVANLETVSADHAAAGTKTKSEYTLIVVDGAVEQLPSSLTDKLVEGGRIVSGLLLRDVTRLAFGRKVSGQVSIQPVEDLGIPVLGQFAKPKSWSFS